LAYTCVCNVAIAVDCVAALELAKV
jgi:hypothetical protein